MKHYQCEQYNALDAISQAQRIAFAPMLLSGELVPAGNRGARLSGEPRQDGATTADTPATAGSANMRWRCCWTWGWVAVSVIWPESTMCSARWASTC